MNKFLTTAATILVLGSATSVFADEAPENKIGDRYPMLEQTYRPVASHATQQRKMAMGLYTNQAPENKIGDRYPWLEAATQPTARTVVRVNRTTYSFTDKSLFDRQSTRAVF
jgi:hypothetical protein